MAKSFYNSKNAKILQDYTDSFKQQAEELVVEGFPSKILELNNLMSKQFAERNFHFEYDITDTNTQVYHKLGVINPLIRQLFGDANLLKMWINLVVPKIVDGNNFEFDEIQSEALKEITNVESKAASYFNQISYYFKIRADLVSAVSYKPYIKDYRRAVQETDENEFFSMTLMLGEIRDHYTSLHDMISKNMEKLKKTM